jgi:hypothetical protein
MEGRVKNMARMCHESVKTARNTKIVLELLQLALALFQRRILHLDNFLDAFLS